jgi:hypothetical protein
MGLSTESFSLLFLGKTVVLGTFGTEVKYICYWLNLLFLETFILKNGDPADFSGEGSSIYIVLTGYFLRIPLAGL